MQQLHAIARGVGFAGSESLCKQLEIKSKGYYGVFQELADDQEVRRLATLVMDEATEECHGDGAERTP